MPAKDRYHTAVRHALESDGWTITSDPFTIRVGERDLFIDLGAERLIAADRGTEKIAVEVKELGGISPIASLEQAVGQFGLYSSALARREPDRTLFLAIPESSLKLIKEPIGQMLLEDNRLRVMVFDPVQKKVVQWLVEKS